MRTQVCTPDDRCRNAKINELFEYDNFARVPADVVEAGDICCISGIDDVLVVVPAEHCSVTFVEFFLLSDDARYVTYF